MSDGAAVHVLGTCSDGWAYIEYYGVRGHVKLSNLTKYNPPPAAPVVSTGRTDYVWNENVTITWAETEYAEKYHLEVYRDGTRIIGESLGLNRSYELKSAQAGVYEVRVKASNLSGYSPAGVCTFTVRDIYTVSFDARGGTGAPEAQTQVLGDPMVLPMTEPIREGYTFLGWTADPAGSFVEYKSGDSLVADDDMTLYAVWKSNDAVPQTLTITKLPIRTMFLVGEELDTTGMELRLDYSDGSGHTVTSGFTTGGYSSEELGVKTVTVTCEGLTAAFEVEIVSYIPGDINLDKFVNRDDVMQLLWHITFPDRFPIETPADFNADGAVNRDDVMQLLWHITFPERFPLAVETPAAPPAEGGE